MTIPKKSREKGFKRGGKGIKRCRARDPDCLRDHQERFKKGKNSQGRAGRTL